MAHMWGGRFTEGPDELLRRFNDSLSFDVRLIHWDILGSMAHSIMLARQGLISMEDRDAILHGLEWIDGLPLSALPDSEDVHSAVEALLFQKIGESAGRLHTGRSRNDQVALDLKLFLREQALLMADRAMELVRALLARARRDSDTPFPGYTHLQRAQVVTIGHYLAAYCNQLLRDGARFLGVHDSAMLCPLGAGALAGSSLPLDRHLTANILGFDGITANSLDSVSDRDSAAEALFSCALSGVHLSRLAEEMILWSSSEFRVLILPDRLCTGSSLMPHKKNPDVPELVRGKTGRLLGNLTGFLAVLKGTPMAYNKDMQEDKETLFDSLDTLSLALEILTLLWREASFDPVRSLEMVTSGNLSATILAELLVLKGVPFREAHHRVGRAVVVAQEQGLCLETLPQAELCNLLGLTQLPQDLLTPRGMLRKMATAGSPSADSVDEQLESLANETARIHDQVRVRRDRLPTVTSIQHFV